jgi:hypothetical protein
MSKIEIDKNDWNSILLTELLPYEVPLIFSNEGFYLSVKDNTFKKFFDPMNLKKSDWTIPFNYEVRKSGGGNSRTLSIIHPYSQLGFIDFYKKYETILTNLCTKSPFSLRHIVRRAKYYYVSDDVKKDEEFEDCAVEVEPDILDEDTKFIRSFFVYKPLDLIYKFYEGHDFRVLEQKYKYYLYFDISKCFYNIYTHTISWAVKGKAVAKRNKSLKNVFEVTFDELIRRANYDETNGIVVGPEVSRIFAEIILQRIDVKVINILEKKNIKLGIHYEVRRYVDDHFIFTSDKEIENILFESYEKCLEEYKLYINSSKTIHLNRPFISDVSIARKEIRRLFLRTTDDLIYLNEEVIQTLDIRSPYSASKEFIYDFQKIIKQYNVDFSVANKDVLRYIKGLIKKIKRNNLLDNNKKTENIFLFLLDIAFYVYSLDINTNSSFKISQIIVLVNDIFYGRKEDIKQTIISKIGKEIKLCFDIYMKDNKKAETNMEILNLLISIKPLFKYFRLSESKLGSLFCLFNSANYSDLNYFQICTLLYYIEDKPEYNTIRNKIVCSVVERFRDEDGDIFKNAELTMLFLDYMTCPYVSNSSKEDVIKYSHYVNKDFGKRRAELVAKKEWFIKWDSNLDLESLLKKKEWNSMY